MMGLLRTGEPNPCDDGRNPNRSPAPGLRHTVPGDGPEAFLQARFAFRDSYQPWLDRTPEEILHYFNYRLLMPATPQSAISIFNFATFTPRQTIVNPPEPFETVPREGRVSELQPQ